MRVSIRHVGSIGMLAVLVLRLQPRVGFSQAAGNPSDRATASHSSSDWRQTGSHGVWERPSRRRRDEARRRPLTPEVIIDW